MLVPVREVLEPVGTVADHSILVELLTTAVPSDVRPLISVDQAGWAVSGFSGFNPVAGTTPSATCAGCGATRLIVASDGPLFSGPIFTAWTLDDDYDVTQFDWPITIGTTPGRFSGSADGTTPAAKNRVRVVWPLSPGRTAFVEAGLCGREVRHAVEWPLVRRQEVDNSGSVIWPPHRIEAHRHEASLS